MPVVRAADTAAPNVSYRESAAPQIAVLAVPDVVHADRQARELLQKIQEKLATSNQRVRKVHIFWVSPDSHVNPQTEAIMRVLHLGLQNPDPNMPRRDIIRAEHVTPSELAHLADEAVKDEKHAFTHRVEFFKEMTSEAPLGDSPLTPRERGLIGRFLQRAKINLLHTLGIPNGAQIRKFYDLRKTPISRQELLINLTSGAVRLSLQYLIADNFLRDEFGAGFWPMMAWSTASTIFTSVFTEASLAQRTQGVSYNVRTGKMEPDAGYQILSSIAESILLVRGPSALLGYGLGPGFTWEHFWQTGETSSKSTFSKALWEKKIREMRDREEHADAKRMRRDPTARPTPKYKRPSFWVNQGLALGLNIASFVDQFGRFSMVRNTMLLMGAVGMGINIFINQKERTWTGFSRLWQRLQGRNPDARCATLLQVEYEDIPLSPQAPDAGTP